MGCICLRQLLMVFLLVVSVVGCGGSDRPPLAQAVGKVTLDGEVMAGATVTFIPVEGGRPTTSMTDAEGMFEMNTYGDDDGAPVGDHFVSVMKVGGKGASMLANEAPASSDDDDVMTGEDSLSPNLGGADGQDDTTVDIESLTDYYVPQRYMDAKNSGLRVTVPPEGSDRLNLVLVSE